MAIPITELLTIGGKLLERVIPDPTARAAANLELAKLAQTGELAALQAETTIATAQIDVNRTEASHPSLFVSGWRPFIGWVCGVGLAYAFLLRPVFNPMITHWTGVGMEALDMGTMITLLGGMLGLGGLRTVERVKGVARG